MQFVTGQHVGAFEILGPLGAGGMGRVYRARDAQLGREVAIKVIGDAGLQRPDAIRRLLGEARAASALNHPNILVVHAVGEHEGTPYVVTELVDGVTLRHMLASGPLSIPLALDVLRQTCAGLAKAHAAGLVHRDLKPENLMYTRDGVVKVLDFGLAKRADSPDAPLDLSLGVDPTATGLVMGTAPYMSPEQARGQAAEARSDLFALGIVAYELLTGKNPFRRATLADTISAVLRDSPPPLQAQRPEVSPELEHLVMSMLEKEPVARLASARAFEDQVVGAHLVSGPLRGAGFGSGTGMAPPPAGTRASAGAHPPRRRWLLAAAAVVLLGAASGWLWRSRGTPAPPPSPFAPGVPVVAVMAIDDKTGDDELRRADVGRVLSDAFVQILYDCQGVQVVSPVRIRSLVMREKRPFADTAHDLELAGNVCRRAGATTILAGSLSRIGSQFVLDATLSELDNGRLLGSFTAKAAGKDTLLETLTTRLSAEVTTTLASARGVQITGGRSIDEITTRSFDAYSHFAHGMDRNNGGDFEGAVVELERAVAMDPSLGSAWSELACAYSFLGQNDRAHSASERAMALRDHMNRRERLWVEANSKWVDGESGDAVRASLQRYLHEFPDDRQAQFYIGLAYHWLDHDCKAAIAQYEVALRLTPEYYPITKGLADCAKESGDPSRAITVLKQFVEAYPNGAGADQARGYMQALRGGSSS